MAPVVALRSPEVTAASSLGDDMGGPKVSEAAERYLSERVGRGEIRASSAAKIGVAVRELVAAAGDKPMRRLDRSDAQAWLELTAAKGQKASTRRLRWSMLNVFCEWAVDEELLGRNPFRKCKPPKPPRSVPRALSREEVAAVLGAVPDLRARVVVMLMVQQGLRCVGVASLRVEDVDLGRRVMRVVEKGGHERVLPVTEECAEVLGEYLSRFPASSGPLVRAWRHNGGSGRVMGDPVASDRGLSPATISKWVSEWMRSAGVKVAAGDGKAAHSFRHTCATDMLEAGADLVEVRDMLGHTSVGTTNRYLASSGGRLARAAGGRRYGGRVLEVAS